MLVSAFTSLKFFLKEGFEWLPSSLRHASATNLSNKVLSAWQHVVTSSAEKHPAKCRMRENRRSLGSLLALHGKTHVKNFSVNKHLMYAA